MGCMIAEGVSTLGLGLEIATQLSPGRWLSWLRCKARGEGSEFQEPTACRPASQPAACLPVCLPACLPA